MSEAVGAGLFDRPVLVLDPGMHTASIRRADVASDGRQVVTGSIDRTVRVWDASSGHLIRTIRLPQGPGDLGKVFAVAISPDGKVIAAGGWTGGSRDHNIYLFDAETGAMTGRIEGLPNVINHLAFSPDGQRLAAALGNRQGLRLYDREVGWSEIARDADYGDGIYGAAFAPDGRLATTSDDGWLRLYGPEGNLLHAVDAGDDEPDGLAYSPDGTKLAVGFAESTDVWLFDGRTLDPLPAPDTTGIDDGNLSKVAWSADGTTLFAGGRYGDDSLGLDFRVVGWARAGCGPRRTLPTGSNSIASLRPLPGGDLLVAAQDPWLGRLGPDGTLRWSKTPQQMDFRGQHDKFGVSSDGQVVDFSYEPWGKGRARFDMATLALTVEPPDDGRTAPPLQEGPDVTNWENGYPRLNGAPLPLDPYEKSQNLAIHPDGTRFVLGTDWSLRFFDASGAQLWRWKAPSVTEAVNISGDGRLVVAAYADGTLRWHRMKDGVEILALFPMIDRENWVAWTPEGVYAATPGARGLLRWHVNHGWDAAAEAVPVSAIPETHRPEVIPHVLPELSTKGALSVAELTKLHKAVRRATASDVAPGARLHVLAVGINNYGEAAHHLKLHYADQDALDVAATLQQSQSTLYDQVLVSSLVNEEATKRDIIRELRAMRDAMSRGNGNDLAVILFSGHGEMVEEDKFFLLPHNVDINSIDSIEETALASVQLHDRLADITKHGRAILFLDACRSGGATLPLDRSLRAMLAAPNLSVITSSRAGEISKEHADWQNGAFTEALLEAFEKADSDHDTMIRVSDLSGYLCERVAALTDDTQHPDVEIRFDARIFATAS